MGAKRSRLHITAVYGTTSELPKRRISEFRARTSAVPAGWRRLDEITTNKRTNQLAGSNAGEHEKESVPNSLANALLSLHSDIERKLSSPLVQPDTTPVPPSHDEPALGGCPIRVLDEKGELPEETVSEPALQTSRVFSYHLFVRQLIVHTLVRFLCEGVHHDQNAIWWTAEHKSRTNAITFKHSRCIHNRTWLTEPRSV